MTPYNARNALVIATCDLRRHLYALEAEGKESISLDALWKLLSPVNAAVSQLHIEETGRVGA